MQIFLFDYAKHLIMPSSVKTFIENDDRNEWPIVVTCHSCWLGHMGTKRWITSAVHEIR